MAADLLYSYSRGMPRSFCSMSIALWGALTLSAQFKFSACAVVNLLRRYSVLHEPDKISYDPRW